jgi:release factor glutamine methyltransferase
MQSITIKQLIQRDLTKLATQLNLSHNDAKFQLLLLLQHALNVNRAWLIAHENDALQANIYAAYSAMLQRRLNGEPIAYILGYREFYGLNLKVSIDTLIPRADTETLVEAALAKISLHEKSHILDLGTGTGAIALAIAKHRPQAHVTALDASQAALDIAIENAQNLNIPNVKFILSDWSSALNQNNIMQKFDVIVSNPPYIEAADTHLKQGDLRFEPLSALASGADGLDAIRTIITQAPNHLNPHGWLLLEHGYNQADKVAALLKQAGFSEVSHAKDLAGIERVTIGKL